MDKRLQRKQQKKRRQHKKEKQKRLTESRKRRQEQSLAEVRKTGRQLKPLLRKVGCDLPFYDYIDSYE